MSDKKIEIVFHVAEELNHNQIETMESTLAGYPGIWEANVTEGKSHLVRVAYNPQVIDSAQALGYMHSQNLHAARIG